MSSHSEQGQSVIVEISLSSGFHAPPLYCDFSLKPSTDFKGHRSPIQSRGSHKLRSDPISRIRYRIGTARWINSTHSRSTTYRSRTGKQPVKPLCTDHLPEPRLGSPCLCPSCYMLSGVAPFCQPHFQTDSVPPRTRAVTELLSSLRLGIYTGYPQCMYSLIHTREITTTLVIQPLSTPDAISPVLNCARLWTPVAITTIYRQ